MFHIKLPRCMYKLSGLCTYTNFAAPYSVDCGSPALSDAYKNRTLALFLLLLIAVKHSNTSCRDLQLHGLRGLVIKASIKYINGSPEQCSAVKTLKARGLAFSLLADDRRLHTALCRAGCSTHSAVCCLWCLGYVHNTKQKSEILSKQT